MPSQKSERPLTNKESGILADIYVSDKRYQDALNEPYNADNQTGNLDIDTAHTNREAADTVLATTIMEVGIHADPEVRRWEAGRRAILSLLGKNALGSFENYFLGIDAIPRITEANPELLPNGEPEIVATNNRIVRLSKTVDDPLEFFDTALGVIDRQKKASHAKIGPENYATTLKLFSDKYVVREQDINETNDDSLTLPDLNEVKGLANEAFAGFFSVAKRDEPNYLEMTNIYATIRMLPKGVMDPKFTQDLLLYTAKNMDQYNTKVGKVLISAMAKIDTTDYPLEASAIVNMTLHRMTTFETTQDVQRAVRAIDNLTKNPQTDAALAEFLTLAEGFQGVLNIDGIDEVMDRLSHIIHKNTEHVDTSIRAKDFATNCMKRANWDTRQQLASGRLTQAQTEDLREKYFRIKENFQKI